MSVRTPLLAAALAAGAALLPAVPAVATAPPGFGTAAVAKGTPGRGTAVVVRSVDVGRQDGFDRVVFTLSGPVAAYRVEYVPRLVQEGSGTALPVEGGAVLEVVLSPTDWTDSPAPPTNTFPRYPGLRHVRFGTDFEGFAQYGIGQAAKDGFRVLRLTGPDRLVVDVAHPDAAPTTLPTTPPTTPATTTSAAPPPTTPTSAPTVSTTSGPSPVTTSAAAAAGPVDPDTGRGSPIPAILIGAVSALGVLAVASIALRLTRRPTA